MLNRVLIILAIIAALLGLHYYDRGKAVERAKNEMVSSYNKALLEKIEQSQRAEDEIRNQSKQLIDKKDEKIKLLGNSVKRLNGLFYNRPQRPLDHSINTLPSPSCTGRELFREDGEFLTREASRADRVVIERDYYYREYLNLYNVLEEMRKDVKNSNE